jgi:hypothetical protein
MPPRPVPRRHWRSYGSDPLPSGHEALDEPLRAFPSWFLRIGPDTRQREVVMIRRCRGDHSRLGYALMLCYLRYGFPNVSSRRGLK